MFGFQKILQKNKLRKTIFFHVQFHYEKYTKENQIELKLIVNLYILKLFNLYTILKDNKRNEFEETYKNILITFNLLFFFLSFVFFSIFFLSNF